MPVQIWTARLERPLTDEEHDAMLALMPPARRERLSRIQDVEKHREPLCAYMLLSSGLRQVYGWHQLPEIALTDNGKPYFPDCPDVHFNISHTAGAVIAAISDQPVGVDIERVRPVSPRAMERLAKASTPEEFFQSWVRREARSKRSGNGVATMVRSETPLNYGEHYHEIITYDGYVAGVACSSTDLPQVVSRLVLGGGE